jgi:hypothetical protein
MRRVHKQQARRLLVPIQKAVRAPGRGQHGIARTDRQPLASEDRVQFALLHDDGDFRVRRAPARFLHDQDLDGWQTLAHKLVNEPIDLAA